jgi:hypothetical protein
VLIEERSKLVCEDVDDAVALVVVVVVLVAVTALRAAAAARLDADEELLAAPLVEED